MSEYGQPCVGTDRQGWCNWRNEQLEDPTVEWIVVEGGVKLVTKQSAIDERIKADAAKAERERQRFNHRQRYPLSRPEEAA